MDKVEKARRMFQELEMRGVSRCHAAQIAKRTFFIEDSLSVMRDR